jgi:hypothetical protein
MAFDFVVTDSGVLCDLITWITFFLIAPDCLANWGRVYVKRQLGAWVGEGL